MKISFELAVKVLFHILQYKIAFNEVIKSKYYNMYWKTRIIKVKLHFTYLKLFLMEPHKNVQVI